MPRTRRNNHLFVSTPSMLSRTFAQTVHAAASSAGKPEGNGPRSPVAKFGGAFWVLADIAPAPLVQRDQSLDLPGLGGPTEAQFQSKLRRASGVVPPSAMIRRRQRLAHSTYTGSFSVTNAWKGVLVSTRRIVQTSRLGASKAAIDGYGTVRRQKV